MKLLRYMMAVHRTVLTKTRTKALLQAKQAMVLYQMKIQKRLSQSLRLTVALMIPVSACCIMMMTHTQTIQYFMHLSANSWILILHLKCHSHKADYVLIRPISSDRLSTVWAYQTPLKNRQLTFSLHLKALEECISTYLRRTARYLQELQFQMRL